MASNIPNIFAPNNKTLMNKAQNEKRIAKLINTVLGKEKIETLTELYTVLTEGLIQYKPSTVKRMLKTIKTQVDFDIPLTTIFRRINTVGNHNNYISQSDFDKMFSVAVKELQRPGGRYTRYFILFILCGMFGLRISDAQLITIEELKKLQAEGVLCVRTKKTGVIATLVNNNPEILNLVIDRFTSTDSKQTHYKLFTHHYEQTLNKVKPPGLGFHSLRFLFSVDKIEKYQEMGHATPSMTDKYQRQYIKDALVRNVFE